MVGADSDRLIPSENSSLFPDEEQCHFFAGLVVHGAPRSSEPRDGHAANTAAGETRGVVSEVRPGTVTVDWLTGAGSDVNPPPTTMPARCLFPLSYYAHTRAGSWATAPSSRRSIRARRTTNPRSRTRTRMRSSKTASTRRRRRGRTPRRAPRHARRERVRDGGRGGRGESRHRQGDGTRRAENVPREKGEAKRKGANPRGAERGAEKDGEGGEGTGASPVTGASPDGDDAPLSGNDAPEEVALVPPIRPTAVIVGTHTRVDVHWQDGTKTRRVLSRDLVPILHLGEHDFWPEQFVARREEADPDAPGDVLGPGPDPRTRTEENENAAGSPNDLAAALGGVPVPDATPETVRLDPPYGVVETVNPVERIARVRWLPRRRRAGSHARDATMVRAGRRVGLARFRRRRRGDARRARVGFGVRAPRGRRLRVQTRRHRRPMGRRPERIKSQPRSDGETDGVEAASEPNSRLGSADAESDAESDAPGSDAESDAESDASGSDARRSAAEAEDAVSSLRVPRARAVFVDVGRRGDCRSRRPSSRRLGFRRRLRSAPEFLLVVNQHEEEDAGSLLDADDFSDGVSSEASWETLSDGDADDAADGANRTTGDGARRRGVPEANPNAAARNALPGAHGPIPAQAWVRAARARRTRLAHRTSATIDRDGRGGGGRGGGRMTSRRTAGRAPRRARWEVSREDATRMAEEFAAVFRAAAGTRENRRDEGGGGGGRRRRAG